MITSISRHHHAAAWTRRTLLVLAAGMSLAACTSVSTTQANKPAATTQKHPTLAQIMGEEPMYDELNAWASNCYAGFEQDVLALAGEESLDCGFVRIDALGSDPDHVNRCLRIAAAGRKPFRAGHIDADGKTMACDVAIRDGEGQLWRLWYDFDPSDKISGGKSDGVLVASRCSGIQFHAGSTLPGSFFAMSGCEVAKPGEASVPYSPGYRPMGGTP
jgi:hypothetical protein